MFKHNEVALVTGAAAGIGYATALAFAKAGCIVVLADRDEVQGQQAAQKIRSEGGEALFVKADMAIAADIIALHQQLIEKYGRLDIACNNAGIEGEQAPTELCTLENFDRVIGINLRGVFVCMQEQIKLMRPNKKGAIVNMASIAGLVGFPGSPAYCASKAAVIQLTKVAALECAEDNIRVNAICPGVIATPMIDRVTHKDPATEQQYAAMHPMNRMGTPQEIADTVVFLSSSQAGFITGQALAVDGGFVSR